MTAPIAVDTPRDRSHKQRTRSPKPTGYDGADRGELLSTGAVAKLLGKNPKTIRAWMKHSIDGFPQPLSINRRFYLPRPDVMTWLQTVTPAPQPTTTALPGDAPAAPALVAAE